MGRVSPVGRIRHLAPPLAGGRDAGAERDGMVPSRHERRGMMYRDVLDPRALPMGSGVTLGRSPVRVQHAGGVEMRKCNFKRKDATEGRACGRARASSTRVSRGFFAGSTARDTPRSRAVTKPTFRRVAAVARGVKWRTVDV